MNRSTAPVSGLVVFGPSLNDGSAQMWPQSLQRLFIDSDRFRIRTSQKMRLVLAIDELGLAGIRATKPALGRHDVDRYPLALFGAQENQVDLAGSTLLYIFRVGSGV